jgi:hypothetical protein
VAREVLRAYYAPVSEVGTACRSPDTAHTVVAGNAEMREINLYSFSAACGFMRRATGCPFPLGSFFLFDFRFVLAPLPFPLRALALLAPSHLTLPSSP